MLKYALVFFFYLHLVHVLVVAPAVCSCSCVSGEMLQICTSVFFPLLPSRYSCYHCRPLSFNIIPSPSHTHVYTFTFISKDHALTDQKYIALCAASQTVMHYIGMWHFGWTVARETLHSKAPVIDTCTDAHTLKITLRSLGHCYLTPSHPPTHTHTHSSRAASLLTPFHLAHTPAGGFS